MKWTVIYTSFFPIEAMRHGLRTHFRRNGYN
jgi:hypothetical protein